MSARTNPFRELEQLFERMSRQFDESSGMWDPQETFGRFRSRGEPMAVDLVERDEEFEVTVDLPGFERDDVQIEVTDRTLRIEAEREESVDEEEEEYLRQERRHESMRRSIRLPDEVDKENVTARMKHGVLTVSLPKIEAEDARTIDIE